MKLLILSGLLVATATYHAAAQPGPAPIQLNQEGFYPGAAKMGILTKPGTAEQFFVLDARGRDTVYRGSLSQPIPSRNSSIITRVADFSPLVKPGKYYVHVEGVGHSFPFNVSSRVHQPTGMAALKAFYYQRVSMVLDPVFAGKWSRAAGHPDTAVLVHASAASATRKEGAVIPSPGGWYDAGDYNKYIVNSGITMGTMLSAYEDFPEYFASLKTNIPESDNRVPDIIDELLYNLRWMITMQDPSDGGVYHKCTNASFDGMVMPGVTKLPRYVVQKGTAATLDFAAVMAQGARILQNFTREFPGLADSCLSAARKAWDWAQLNPAMRYDQNAINNKFSPKITTGAYGDNRFEDEMFWAAAELYATTKDDRYLPAIKQSISISLSIPSWANVHLPGLYSLVRRKKDLPQAIRPLIEAGEGMLVKLADQLLSAPDSSAFRTVMGARRADFNWGGNSNAANQGIALVNAYLITRNKRYVDAALTNLDYILGRNATGYCFVTGIGSRPPMHPHHRPSVADGIDDPVPGMLVGGPNPGQQDKCQYPFSEPETSYTDLDCSYASNEIAINWNAPLVYLANAIEALQYTVGYSNPE